MQSRWPTTVELANFLRGAGVSLSASFDGALAIAAAVTELEEVTRYRPFLATGTDTTRVFDGQWSDEIRFAGGLVSLAANGVTINNSVYASTFYALKPNNAPALGKPYTSLKFGRYNTGWLPVINGPAEEGITYLGGAQRIITITGKWGFGLAVPDDVYYAVVQKAASFALSMYALSFMGGAVSIKTEDTDTSYSQNGKTRYNTAADAWDANFLRVVNRYKRMGMS